MTAELMNTEATMSSLEIAEATGKEHRHVMRDIRNMLDSLGEKDSPNLGSRLNSQGKQQPVYHLDHDHVMCLVSGYNVKLRMAVIKRWKALESGEATPGYKQLPDFTDPAVAAMAWAEQYQGREEAEKSLAITSEALSEAEDELNLITVDEYRSLSHRYFARAYSCQLGKRASRISREAGEAMTKQPRAFIHHKRKDAEVVYLNVYKRWALEQAEAELREQALNS